MKQPPDTELNTELQELYLTGKQWLADLEFLTSEQRFLASLAGPFNYLPQSAFADDLSRTAEEQHSLQLQVVRFMSRLESMICHADAMLAAMDIALIEDFCTLQTEVAGALDHLKAVKYRMVGIKISISLETKHTC